MDKIKTRSLRGWTAVLLVMAALAAAACGSNSSGSSSTPSTPATTSSTHTTTSSSSSNGIPQGNVGDNDADNHGAPSDGDGNL